MKNVGMLEIVDFPAGIAAPSDQSERQNGYPLDTATSLLLHDLRSPLSAICGCAEMLLHGNLGPAASRRVATNVHRAAGRMRELIADVARIAHRDTATDEIGDLRLIFDNGTESGKGRTRWPLVRSHAASVVRASAMPCPLIAASITMLARLRTGP